VVKRELMDAYSHPPYMNALALRPARLADAPELANLATQLGYPSSPSEVEERMRCMLKDPNQFIIVATSGSLVIGWAHAYVCCTVESETSAELGGLLVDESHRGIGVGGKLVEMVEEWARQKGCSTVSVRSNVLRHEAHKFYASHGYDQIKTQYTFRKRL